MSDTEKSMVKRVLLLAAAVAMATMVWFVVGDESIAAESGKAGDKVLATVNGEEITEQAVVAGLAGRLLALDRQRHDMIQGAVESTIVEKLFQQEADKRGVSVDELRETEVAAKAEALSQEEVDTFYEAQKKRSGGRIQPLEQIGPRIREYLALQAVETSLRGEAKIATHIDPFRIDVEAIGPSKGPENAKVTIVEFSDFECPYCSRVNPALEQVTKTYGDKVRIVFRQFPLVQIHPNAMGAGMASLCANEQGKFWQMHDAMFADQKNLGSEGLAKIAGTIEGMDVEALSGCLESDKFRAQVERDIADGNDAGVTGTPAMFINGRFLNGAVPFEQLSAIIDEELEG